MSDPLDVVVAQLRHAYAQLVGGQVRDHRAFADGLLAPQIRKLEQFQRAVAATPGRASQQEASHEHQNVSTLRRGLVERQVAVEHSAQQKEVAERASQPPLDAWHGWKRSAPASRVTRRCVSPA
jgi:hypothetical protein